MLRVPFGLSRTNREAPLQPSLQRASLNTLRQVCRRKTVSLKGCTSRFCAQVAPKFDATLSSSNAVGTRQEKLAGTSGESTGGRICLLEIGIDAFNVFNHTNDKNYVGTLTSPFFGRANAANPLREIQLTTRYHF